MINKNIDDLIYTAIFSSDDSPKKKSREQIYQIASDSKIFPASIHNLYQALGRGEISGFTVPAINIRTLTYDTARIIFRLAFQKNIGGLIFEIARSEIKYTDQRPEEYTTAILAAAIKENYQGPVFIQGDHYQFKASVYKETPQIEINKIKNLIKESIEAGFYNIDVDASTLVDLEKKNLDEQQKENYLTTALITKYIREIEPKNVTVSIGGEIGHIGGKNSTIPEFEAFMKGYLKEVQSSKFKVQNGKIQGISKVSVQTGTSHGGIPLPDGTIADVKLDFDVLKNIGKVARKKYHLGGSVQHGASTLPDQLFDRFPKIGTLEIHLATGFQNIVYDYMPKKLRNEIYSWIKTNLKDEWKEGQTEEQFIYKTRKKALGPFKKQLWSLSEKEKEPILEALEKQFEFLFKKLNIVNTKKLLKNIYSYG
jgi:fructose/tagatose bisphosphate aldolase